MYMNNNYSIYSSHSFVHKHAEFVCYDDGCHLRKFAQNSCRKDATPTATLISQLNFVVDKLHMKGHVDPWCKANCDAKSFTDLDNVRWRVHKIQDRIHSYTLFSTFQCR